MPAPADRPLVRCTLNLYAEDADAMRKHYGRGWTEQVRRLVKEHIRDKAAERRSFDLRRI